MAEHAEKVSATKWLMEKIMEKLHSDERSGPSAATAVVEPKVDSLEKLPVTLGENRVNELKELLNDLLLHDSVRWFGIGMLFTSLFIPFGTVWKSILPLAGNFLTIFLTIYGAKLTKKHSETNKCEDIKDQEKYLEGEDENKPHLSKTMH